MDRAAEHGVAADGRRSDPEQAAAERQDISRTIDTMVVIDASVLTDIFLANRPRHESAKKLWEKIRASRTTVRIPMHGLFELSTAMKREGIKKPQDFEFNRAISEEDPLTLELVPIDQDFVQNYLSVDLPYLKAGDLIYLAMTKADNAELITEDQKQYKKAKEAAVAAYRIDEYLERTSSGA